MGFFASRSSHLTVLLSASEFARPRDEGKPNSRSRTARYSDDEEDDDDDRRPSQRKNQDLQNTNSYSRHRDSPPPRNNQNAYRGPPPNDDYRGDSNRDYRSNRDDRYDYRDDRQQGGNRNAPISGPGSKGRQDDDYMRGGQSFDDGYRTGGKCYWVGIVSLIESCDLFQ